MIRRALTFVTLICAASPLAAQSFELTPPIQCTLGDDCFIQQYVDHDPGRGAKDYRCAPLSYDGHKGTDFALRTLKQMEQGVNVLAAAPGTVLRMRNTVKDQLKTAANAEQVAGRECGNGVVIAHGDGWETQYCHLKKGSITVRRGDTVKAGSVIGKVGLSGATQFPHVHLTVRQNGAVVDPFDPDGQITCGAPDRTTLWKTDPRYDAGGIIYTSFHDQVPSYDDVKSGRAATQSLPATAPALVVYGLAFGGQAGDTMRLVIKGPGGEIIDHTDTLAKNQAQFFRAAGKRTPQTGWPKGRYTGTALLIRKGRVISTQVSHLTMR